MAVISIQLTVSEANKIYKIKKICSQYYNYYKGVHDCCAIREAKASRRIIKKIS